MSAVQQAIDTIAAAIAFNEITAEESYDAFVDINHVVELKQQSQVHLAQISRLTEVQRKSLNNTPTPEASLLKRELKRRTDQLTQMRGELLRVQTSKDSMNRTKAGPHLAVAGFQTVGIEEAIKEYERIVNNAKEGEVEVVKVLLGANVSVLMADGRANTALHVAASAATVGYGGE